MIITTLFSFMLSTIMFMLGAVNIPKYPVEIASILNFIHDMIVGSMGFVYYLLSAPVVTFAITTLLLVTLADWLYHLGFWAIEKIPILGIRR